MQNDNPTSDENHQSGEFVVALPHSAEVIGRVEKVFTLKCERDDSAALGLTRVVPSGLENAAGALGAAVRDRLGKPGNDRLLQVLGRPDPDAGSALDNLMFCLRYDSAEGYGGWFPSMGKNRTLHNVTGVPHVDGGAVTYPELASKQDMKPAAEATLGAGVRVGILDTGLYAHPDLAGSYFARPEDLLPSDGKAPFSRSAGHATFIAGLVRRQAPSAELIVRSVLSDADATATVWDVAHAMVEFRDLGVRILNLSLGCWTADGQPPMVLERAVRILAQDMVIVAAAGNHGIAAEDADRFPGVTPRSAFFPASLDDVIAVGADVSTPEGMRRAPFSPNLPWVTFAAEGEAVVSTFVEGDVEIESQIEEFGGYARWSGTSFAAGTVTGAIAALTEPGQAARPAAEKLREVAGAGTGEVRIFEPGDGAAPSTGQ